MTDDYPLLDDRDDVVGYLERTGLLARVADTAEVVEVDDVTAGNMNRVFLARGPLGSIALKQAPPFVQSIGPEWPIDPSRIAAEASTYALLAERVPDSIPEIIGFDPDLHVLLMEDLSDLAVLRDALAAELAPGGLALDHVDAGAVVGGFVGALAAATTREALGDEAFAELASQTGDEGLMQITRDFLLGYPLREHDTNRSEQALDDRVRAVRTSPAVAEAVERMRERFETAGEALIHGDLHTGSVMVGVRDDRQVVKVFDPEFAFVGPIGMDLGLYWAGVEIAVATAWAAGDDALALRRWEGIAASLDAFTASAGLEASEVDSIADDAWRFAGIEIVRRVAGFSHASDLDDVLADEPRVAAQAAVLEAAAAHIVTGRGLGSAEALRPVDPAVPLVIPAP